MRNLLHAAKSLGTTKGLLVTLLIALAALSSQPAGRVMSGVIDRALYDAMAAWYARARPDNIVVVNIDARTLAALGLGNLPGDPERLLARLNAASCVVLDLPLTPGLDYSRLERAMDRHGRIVLVVPRTSVNAFSLLPASDWKTLSQHAAAVSQREIVSGHYGAVSGFVPYQATADGLVAHVALEALRVAGADARETVATYVRPPAALPRHDRNGSVLVMLHHPDDLVQYSYVDVLDGRIPASAFAGKIVFVGHSMWLGEGTYRLSLLAHGEAPRAHLDALVTDAVARRHLVRELPDAVETLVYAGLAIGMALLCLLLSGPTMHAAALGWCVGLVALPLVLLGFRIWLPIGMLPLVCLLIYGLFAWERHGRMLALLRGELAGLRAVATSIGTAPATPMPMLETGGELVDVQSAMRQIRSWQKIYVDMINQLPYPVFFALDGKVAIWNAKAAELVGNADATVAQDSERLAQIERSVDESIRANGEISREITWDGQTSLLLCEPLSNDETESSTGAADDSSQRAHLVCLIAAGDTATYDKQVLRHIAHDLRSPLTSILALIEHRHEEQAEAEHDDHAFLHDLRRQADYSLRIANGFVQLSRAEQLSRERFEPVMLEDLAIEAIGQTLVAARAKSISLCGPSGDLDDTLINADATMLIRAIVNVIDNAIKYSATGTVVTVRIERTDDAQLALHVMDQGIGMSEETVRRLFEPFFQVERVRGPENGVGLGMPFVKAVVERHGGTVEVHSALGRGTDFVVRVPGRG
ncbi:ATP-binding protein [Burkholderia semiarida]|uniref:histidine kinase n=1 Tax=Burkholderia semiarida TaxID=2843303 RepID=A0ABW7KUM2_9BURK